MPGFRRMTWCVGALAVLLTGVEGQTAARQVELGHRSTPVLRVDGLEFKDLNRNGRLDAYEDWRLPPEARTTDLLKQMTLEEMAGVMVHGTLPTGGALGSIGRGDGGGYDLAKTKAAIEERHANSFITRLAGKASFIAEQNNAVQELAEGTRLGIPLTISTDPRHHFEEVLGASVGGKTFSQWPETLGFGAIGDERLMRRFGDVARQEYAAVGIREALSPQADLVTEPRWARASGTFGEDPVLVKRMVKAYVEGFQGGEAGLTATGVMTVVKHWVGYGAEKDGWDGHNFYGRFVDLSDASLQTHLFPFTGAFEAHVAGVMPTYPILRGPTVDGRPLEAVGAGYSKQLLQTLLRDKYKFGGVVVSDWGITSDCNEDCRNGVPAGSKPGPSTIGMDWGVEGLTREERFAKSIGAGVDQVGGTDESNYIVDAVHHGKLSEARVREAAGRVLLTKFQMGLFEQPYVDAGKAGDVAGRPEFVKEGLNAQARAVVVLENRKGLLPVSPGSKVYLVNVAADAATAAGLVVVTDPRQANFALVRAPAPYESQHTGYFFGSRQHEGRLNFVESDKAYAEFLRVSASVPTILTTTLERPLILTNVKDHAAVLLGDFGLADEALMEVITGKIKPEGKLPFELPSSVEAVEKQRSDLPHDSAAPLYKIGYGLRY